MTLTLEADGALDHAQCVIGQLMTTVQQLPVDTEQGYASVTAIYATARQWLKLIEGKRKEAIEPSRKIVSMINDKAKSMTALLDQVIELANQKANAYRQHLERQHQLEQERLKTQAELLDLDYQLAVGPMLEPIGNGANMVTKTIKRYRIVNQDAVPRKYLMVDDEAIMRDIGLGIGQIDGLEIYTETTTSLRTR